MTITNGLVSIEDGKKAAEEYAPARKVRVDIGFVIPEGEDGDAVIKAAGDMAQAHVHRLLRSTSAPVQAHIAAAAGETAAPKTRAKKDDKPKPEGEKTKADLEREQLAELNAADKKPAPEVDDLDDLLGDVAPKPITDAELGKAAQEKNAKMKAEHGDKWAPSKLRDLISTMSGGKRINDIPAADRTQFLEKMAALTI